MEADDCGERGLVVATPDYLQQVIISGRKRAGNGRRASSTRVGLFRRPSVTSLVWASLDLMTVAVAGVMASAVAR